VATTFPAIMAIVNSDATASSDIFGIGRRGFACDLLPPPQGVLTAAQRATVVSTILAGTVATLADVTALIATAVVAGSVTTTHIQRIIAGYGDATVG
jgi:hypothetical protein